MKRVTTLLLLAILFGMGASDAMAQIALGPRAGLGLGDVEDPYLGVEARFDAPSLPVQISASGDYYLLEGDGASLFQLTANGIYEFGIDNEMFTPYAGAGLSIGMFSFDSEFLDDQTDLALHALGGAVFQVESFRPFVQAEFTLGGDWDFFGITGGLLFSLGG